MGRTGKLIKYKGKKYRIGELCNKYKISGPTLHQRIYTHKWSLHKALHTPVAKRSRQRIWFSSAPIIKADIELEEGLQLYCFTMKKYYSKQHRINCYQQLRKDFEDIQQLTVAA